MGVITTITIAATTKPNALPGPVGRYQVEASDHRTHIIDTVTGQLWSSSGTINSGSKIFYEPKLKMETD